MKIKIGFFVLTTFSRLAMAYPVFDQMKYESVMAEKRKVLLHFHADWCPTCVKQGKVLNALAKDPVLQDVTVFKVDYDRAEALKKTFKVNSQTTLVAIRDGSESGRVVSKTSEADLRDFLRSSMAPGAFQYRR